MAGQQQRVTADRSSGWLMVMAGSGVVVAGIVLFVWLVTSDGAGSRRSSGAVAAIIAAGVLIVFRGLRTVRSGERTAVPEWVASTDATPEAKSYRLPASNTGRYQTWMIDGTTLYGPDGAANDLTQVQGGTHVLSHGQAGFNATQKLRFADKTIKIKAVDRHPSTAKRDYDALVEAVKTVVQQHNPSAEFKPGFSQSPLFLVLMLGIPVAGIIIGLVAVILS